MSSVRFAPSPTGKFHLGNLRTAWVSWRFSRALGLPWFVRFEDIDAPRVIPGAQEDQLSDLRDLGMVPDRVSVQSSQRTRHEALFAVATREGVLYPCTCSRKEIAQELEGMASAPHGAGPVYTGRCRGTARRAKSPRPTVAWRFFCEDDPTGRSDFVAARTDASGFIPAYHWACAIDDHDGAHALLVRAWDLAPAILPQRRIFEWLARQERSARAYPAVFHSSLIVAPDGRRLEKRTKGVTWSELAGSGVRAADLLNAFDLSFAPDLFRGFEPGKIWGEAPPHAKCVDSFLRF